MSGAFLIKSDFFYRQWQWSPWNSNVSPWHSLPVYTWFLVTLALRCLTSPPPTNLQVLIETDDPSTTHCSYRFKQWTCRLWVLCFVFCTLCSVLCVLCFVFCVLSTVLCVLCFVFCVLCSVFCVLFFVFSVLCSLFCVLSSVFCVLCFVFCVLCFVFCVLCFVFCVQF